MVRLNPKAPPVGGRGAILRALSRLIWISIAASSSHICCYGAQFTHPAFVRGQRGTYLRHGSTDLPRGLFSSKPKPLCETNPSSNTKHTLQNTDVVVDFVDRRECLSAITFGASAIVNYAGSASATEININSQPRSNTQQNDNMNDVSPVTITLPLEPSSGGTLCVRITVSASTDGNTAPKTGVLGSLATSNAETPFRVYRAIVDTGSPYLVLPSPSSGYDNNDEPNISQWIKSAFASPVEDESHLLGNSDFDATEEVYGAVKGQINWKLAQYTFRDPRLQVVGGTDAGAINRSAATGVVGVLDDALTNEATGGGMMEPYALLGLIRNNNPERRSRFPDPRPTFFEQERMSSTGDESSVLKPTRRIRSFSINGPLRELSLSTESLIDNAHVMRLVDLRKYGDFVDHYAVVVDSVSFDGVSITSKSLKQSSGSSIERPIVAVFDTGLTGCLLIRPFWDAVQKYITDRSSSTDEFKSVSLTINDSQQQQRNNSGSNYQIRSSIEEDRRFYVQPIDLDWFDDEQTSPYVIVLGQTFLSRGALTIDMDKRIAAFNLNR